MMFGKGFWPWFNSKFNVELCENCGNVWKVQPLEEVCLVFVAWYMCCWSVLKLCYSKAPRIFFGSCLLERVVTEINLNLQRIRYGLYVGSICLVHRQFVIVCIWYTYMYTYVIICVRVPVRWLNQRATYAPPSMPRKANLDELASTVPGSVKGELYWSCQWPCLQSWQVQPSSVSEGDPLQPSCVGLLQEECQRLFDSEGNL